MLKCVSHLGKIGFGLPVIALLAACTGIPQNQQATKESTLYHQYAGAPIDGFTYLGRYDSFTSISKYEVVVWTTINDAYLITVRPPCESLRFANSIGLTNTGNRVTQKFDFVLSDHDKCWIESIRPVDYLQLKRDRRQKSAEATTPAETEKDQEQKQ